MAGVKALRKIQMGRESIKGTEVAATTLWRGTGTIDDRLEVVFVEEDVGYLSGVDRTHIPFVQAAIDFDDTPATFEQLPHLLEAGIDTVTPVQDGAGSDYIYTYTFPKTTNPGVKTYTLEGGDDQQEEQFLYAFVRSLKVAGAAKAAAQMSASWIGRQVATGTYTAGVSLPSVEDILFQKSKLYIDAIGGTIGSTQKTNTILGFELNVDTGLRPVFTGDGNLYFSFEKRVPLEVTLALTFEHDGTATGEKSNWRNETARLIRLLAEGSAVGTPGTTYSNKTLIVDLAGKWQSFDKLDEREGNDIVKGTFRARYNSTADFFAEMVIVNELSALP